MAPVGAPSPLLAVVLLLVSANLAAASRPAPHLSGGGGGGAPLLLAADLSAATAQYLELPASFAWSSAPEWGPAADVAVLNRTLAGGGFHRDLTYTLALQGAVAAAAAATSAAAAANAPPPPPAGRLLWRMAGFDKTAAAPGSCVLTVVQPLPPGLYADPYQLEGVVRAAEQRQRRRRRRAAGAASERGWWWQRRRPQAQEDEGAEDAAPDGFRLLGPLDLELPAPACLPTALVVHKRLRPSASLGSVGGSGGGGPATTTAVVVRRLRVPLHAKYPAAVASAAAPLGLGNDQALVAVPPPLLMLRCGGDDAVGAAALPTERVWRPPRRLPASDALSWPVPAGAGAHLALASWGTFWASTAAAAGVVWAVWREAPRLGA
jgi:hypothetical protein